MSQNTPLIQEIYKDYTPPVNVMNTVQILLEYVPSVDLAFSLTIILANTKALSRRRKRQRRPSRAPISQVRGQYHQAWNGQPAEIDIFKLVLDFAGVRSFGDALLFRQKYPKPCWLRRGPSGSLRSSPTPSALLRTGPAAAQTRCFQKMRRRLS